MMNTLIGARIKDLRETKGLTQEDVAKQISCSRQKIARIEKGATDITYSTISAIASVLGVKVEDITAPAPVQKIKYRSTGNASSDEAFDFINKMLDTFYAHRRLYYATRKDDVLE